MSFKPVDYLPYDFANRRHIGPSGPEMQQMLEVIDIKSLEDLIQETVPKELRLKSPLQWGKPKSEREALAILGENIQNYTRKYEQQLQIIYDPSTQTEEYNKRLITIDDNFNVSGGLSNIEVGNMSNDVLGDQMNLNDVTTSQ